MLQDLAKIHKELEGYVEVDSDYDFPKNVHIKYLTQKKGTHGFCKGGKFKCRGNNSLILSTNVATWPVKLIHYNSDASVGFVTRLFVPEDCENCPAQSQTTSEKTLSQTVDYQQSIIEKMTDKIKQLETKNYELQQHKQQYEQLLQQGRESLQQLQQKYKTSLEAVKESQNMIQKLSQSHPMFQG
jgi:myosin heavy subunit